METFSNTHSYFYLPLLIFIECYTDKITVTKIKDQYLTLLSCLTIVEPMTNDEFLQKINEISVFGKIMVCVCDNTNDSENQYTIVGTGTLFIEPKLIRGRQSVGHIEDIVVHPMHRSRGISNVLLERLVTFAKNNHCYKTILDCQPTIKPVYEKAGFVEKGVQMSQYL